MSLKSNFAYSILLVMVALIGSSYGDYIGDDQGDDIVYGLGGDATKISAIKKILGSLNPTSFEGSGGRILTNSPGSC